MCPSHVIIPPNDRTPIPLITVCVEKIRQILRRARILITIQAYWFRVCSHKIEDDLAVACLARGTAFVSGVGIHVVIRFRDADTKACIDAISVGDEVIVGVGGVVGLAGDKDSLGGCDVGVCGLGYSNAGLVVGAGGD